MLRTFDSDELKPLSRLKLVVFDVDGVMTDGRFALDQHGNESKTFHTQDGFGLRRLLDAGIQVAIITGRNSGAVTRRAQELDVKHVFQGCRAKSQTIRDLMTQLGMTKNDCAAVGDDIPDLAMFAAVGTRIAVANAVPELRAAADWQTRNTGGHGAVREIADALLRARELQQ